MSSAVLCRSARRHLGQVQEGMVVGSLHVLAHLKRKVRVRARVRVRDSRANPNANPIPNPNPNANLNPNPNPNPNQGVQADSDAVWASVRDGSAEGDAGRGWFKVRG